MGRPGHSSFEIKRDNPSVDTTSEQGIPAVLPVLRTSVEGGPSRAGLIPARAPTAWPLWIAGGSLHGVSAVAMAVPEPQTQGRCPPGVAFLRERSGPGLLRTQVTLQEQPLSSKPPWQRRATWPWRNGLFPETKAAGGGSGPLGPTLPSSVLRTEGTGVSRLVAKAALPGFLGRGPGVRGTSPGPFASGLRLPASSSGSCPGGASKGPCGESEGRNECGRQSPSPGRGPVSPTRRSRDQASSPLSACRARALGPSSPPRASQYWPPHHPGQMTRQPRDQTPPPPTGSPCVSAVSAEGQHPARH